MSPPSRREFVKAAAAAAGAVLVPPALHGQTLDRTVAARSTTVAEEHGWERIPSILARIKPPTFATRDFPSRATARRRRRHRLHARRSGARSPRAPRRAAGASSCRRGGSSPGRFTCGATSTCTCGGRDDPLRHRSEGVPAVRAHALRGHGDDGTTRRSSTRSSSENIAITGEGTLDGQAEQRALVAVEGERATSDGSRATPNYNVGAHAAARDGGARRAGRRSACSARARYLRPNFIQPYRCRNVLIEGVTIAQLADVGDPSRALPRT